MVVYTSAVSKPEAVARMYHLGGVPPEPLGPGSKEKRSALEALGRAVGLDLSRTSGKVECGRRIAAFVRVPWDSSCFSSGDTITVNGLNRLIDGVVEFKVNSKSVVEDRFIAELMAVVPVPRMGAGNELPHKKGEVFRVPESITEYQQNISAFAAELSERTEYAPEGVDVAADTFSPEDVDFSDGQWRARIADVQDWMNLRQRLELDSPEAFDVSLANALGSQVRTVAELDREALEVRLVERLERALDLRNRFLDTMEQASEGGATLSSASQAWLEWWAESEEEQASESSGPIRAEATTWPIVQFISTAGRDRLELSPPYQRADVWPTADSQMLVESVLRGIPLPSVILVQRTDTGVTKYEVVDGKQRLTSILRFTGQDPRALEVVKQKAERWGVPDLQEIFERDYPRFKRLWRTHEQTSLNATVARSNYFPFPLRKNVQPLSGSLSRFQGKYYSEIRDEVLEIVGEPHSVSDLFEMQDTGYKVPVIIYKDVQTEQVHEVFSLYNKQGKHLNAEEIRNALYHKLAFMRALLVTAGDSDDVDVVAGFLRSRWSELRAASEILDNHKFGRAGYKRTKLLSWVAAALLVEDGRPDSRSTANQINAMLKTIDANEFDKLRNEEVIRDAMLMLAQALTAHDVVGADFWHPRFRNAQGGVKWQELQLVAILIALAAATFVLGDRLVDHVESLSEEIYEASSSELWQRPEKTQSKVQWAYTAKIVKSLLELLGVDAVEADNAIRDRFGRSGLAALIMIAD